MKLIKKSIFAVLILAVMSILVTKVTSATNMADLLDQNIEALALEDPEHPSNFGELFGGGYGYWDDYDDWRPKPPFPYCIRGATGDEDKGVKLPACNNIMQCFDNKILPRPINVNVCWE